MDGNQGSRCTYNIGSLKIISEFAGRLDASEKQAARVATERVDTRIAQYLADCVENQNGNLEINLPMNT